MIVHVVLVKWHEWITAAQIEEVRSAFLGLTSKVPGISGAYWGESLPGGSEGFRHGVVVLAQSPEAMDAYRAHPDHQKLSQMLGTRAARMTGENLQA